jgi:hypothetical protein
MLIAIESPVATPSTGRSQAPDADRPAGPRPAFLSAFPYLGQPYDGYSHPAA